MKCLECGKELKSISNTHLMKCCNLTMREYADKHCISIESLLSTKTKDSHTGLKTKSEIEIKNKKSELTKRNNQPKYLSNEETQIIIGGLLGDAYIFNGNKLPNSTYFILEQGIKQLQYLWWKGTKLSKLGSKFYQYYRYNKVKHRYTTFNQVRTKSMHIIGDIAKYIYDRNGSKYINTEMLNHIDPLGLAIWYMDDGTFNGSNASIASQSFSKSDNDILVDLLKTKFNITIDIKFDYKDMPYLWMNSKESKRFFDIIKQHMFYNMTYKIGETKTPECILGKQIVFDSSHFLDEYDGKCSNLHGGRYYLWVRVKGQINPDTGMVLDYGYIKTILDKYIIKEFDHHCLNYTTKELAWRSTTELICLYIWKVLIEFFPNLYEIELFETPNSSCIYRGPSLDDMKYDKSLDLLNTFTEKDKKWRDRLIIEFSDMFSNIDNEEEHLDWVKDIKEPISSTRKIPKTFADILQSKLSYEGV